MRSLVVALIALVPLPAAGQIPDPAPETVALRFGWAPGDSAVVRTHTSLDRGVQAESGQGRYQLAVRTVEDGLAVTKIALDGQPLAEWLVAPSGEFMAPVFDTPDMIALRQEWEVLVGTWAGADVDLGDTYHLSSVEPMPLIDGATVPALSEIRVTRAACDAATADLACVRLQLIMRPDPVALRLVIEDAVAHAGEPVWQSIGWELEAEVITRPDTLRPLRATIRRRLEAAPRDGSPRIESERRDFTFDWDR